MKLLILCIILSILSWLGASSPIDPKRQLVNRPRIHDLYMNRRARSPQDYGVKGRTVEAKGKRPGVKEYNPTPPPQLRKGQYKCGDRVCHLRPGEIPKGCNGMCQYAV